MKETVRAEELSLAQWERLCRLVRPIEAQHRGELFCIVDAHDRVIGAESRDYVHVNNLRHRAIHILIFNLKGEIFLQRRSIWKDMHPGRWDSSTSGHVAPSESYEQAAHRELREKIGIDCQLESIGKLFPLPPVGNSLRFFAAGMKAFLSRSSGDRNGSLFHPRSGLRMASPQPGRV